MGDLRGDDQGDDKNRKGDDKGDKQPFEVTDAVLLRHLGCLADDYG